MTVSKFNRFIIKYERKIHVSIFITWSICILVLLSGLSGCAVVDLVNMCTTTPEACRTSGDNTEYVRVNGKTYIIERTKDD